MKRAGIVLVFILSIIANIYFGFQKSGFHEDEYYTYYSTNRSLGLYQPDRQWQDRETILDEFVVKEDEKFNYGMVALVQSWDVHPPFYYFVFHTICSFCAMVFTKWTGIITNMIAFSLAFWVLDMILKRLKVSYLIEVLAMAFYGLNPQTISSNMLIRMYAWLSLFVALCALLHIRMVQEHGGIIDIKSYFLRYMLPVVCVSYLGFLTQYFYLFFFVCIGVSYTAWLVFWKKNVRYGVTYVITCAMSLALAVVSYPASVHHLFGGYRGNEAAGSLFDMGNTIMRVSFFAGLLNDFVFAGTFFIIAIVIILCFARESMGTVLSDSRNESRRTVPIDSSADLVILLLGTVGYFLLTSKAALLVGSASNRYEMPIYGLIIIETFVLFQRAFGIGTSDTKIKRSISIVLVAITAVLLVKGIVVDERVLFLYPEDKEKIAFATENRDEVAIVMFNPATPQNVWRLTDELLEYPKVYYMDEENLDSITDDTVANAERIVLYIADDDVQEKAIENLKESTNLDNMSKMFTEDMWSTYILN